MASGRPSSYHIRSFSTLRPKKPRKNDTIDYDTAYQCNYSNNQENLRENIVGN
jgi:hypothetical protein